MEEEENQQQYKQDRQRELWRQQKIKSRWKVPRPFFPSFLNANVRFDFFSLPLARPAFRLTGQFYELVIAILTICCRRLPGTICSLGRGWRRGWWWEQLQKM